MKKVFPVESKHVATNVMIDGKLSKDKQLTHLVLTHLVYTLLKQYRGYTNRLVIFVTTSEILHRSVFSIV